MIDEITRLITLLAMTNAEFVKELDVNSWVEELGGLDAYKLGYTRTSLERLLLLARQKDQEIALLKTYIANKLEVSICEVGR